MKEASGQHSFKFILLPVMTVFILGSLILMIIYHETDESIKNNSREYELASVKNLVTVPYNNNLLDDYLVINNAQTVSGRQPMNVYRARKDNKYVAVVFKPVIARGYGGPLELAVGIAADGSVLGVEVLSHHETEGLGAQVDSKNSDWLANFTDASLATIKPEGWNIQSGGGQFDQISGATITSRGVINAIHKTLEYHQSNHARLYKE